MTAHEHILQLRPCAGFGNRLRALVSGMCAAQDAERYLQVRWCQEVGICRGDLLTFFTPTSFPKFVMIENVVPGTASIDEIPCNSPADWDHAFQQCNSTISPVSIASHAHFHQTDPERWTNHLRTLQPNPRLKAQILNLFQNSTTVVGVHVRRTDNHMSIKNSPTAAFIDAMDAYPQTTMFFVASDDDRERIAMQARFPGRILTAARFLERTTTNGGVDAFLDFLGLSMCSEILGSHYSSFNEMAAAYGGIQLKVIKTT